MHRVKIIKTDASGTGSGSSYCADYGLCSCNLGSTRDPAPTGGCCTDRFYDQCASGNCVDYTCVEPVTTTQATSTTPACVKFVPRGYRESCTDNDDCCPCKCIFGCSVILSCYFVCQILLSNFVFASCI